MKDYIKIINVAIFLLIVAAITVFLRYDIYEFDDFFQSFFYTFDLKTLVEKADHGKYISYFLMKAICHGSSLIANIHPNENILPRIFIGVDFALLAYLYARLTKIFSCSVTVNPLIYLSAFFISISLTLVHFDYFIRWNQHFEYILMFTIFLWFINTICDYFVKDKLPEKKYYLKNGILCFLLGISAYFNIFMALLVTVFLVFYYKIKNEFNLNYSLKILIPISCGALGSMFVFFNPNLNKLVYSRTYGMRSIFTVFDNIKEYSLEWINNLFFVPEIVVINIAILLLIIVAYIQNKKITKAIIFSVVIIVSSATFQYLLILCGKSFVHQYFWISYSRVYLMHYYFCLIPLFILVGEVLKNKKLSYYIVPFLISFFVFMHSIPEFKNKFEISKLMRQEMYMVVKSEIFYTINKYSFAIAPNENLDWDDYTYIPNKKNWCINHFHKNFKLVYNLDSIPLKFVSTKEFLDNAKKDGLMFTNEELQESNFNNFQSKEFINAFTNSKVNN